MQVARELSSEGAGEDGKDVVSSLGDCEFCWGWSRNWANWAEATEQAGQAGQALADRGWQGSGGAGGREAERERRSGSGLGGTRTTRAWTGWAGWARVGNGSDWAAEPLRWAPPAPTQLKCPRPGSPGHPNSGSHVLLRVQACRGLSRMGYDGANQSPGSSRPLDCLLRYLPTYLPR